MFHNQLCPTRCEKYWKMNFLSWTQIENNNGVFACTERSSKEHEIEISYLQCLWQYISKNVRYALHCIINIVNPWPQKHTLSFTCQQYIYTQIRLCIRQSNQGKYYYYYYCKSTPLNNASTGFQLKCGLDDGAISSGFKSKW